MAIVLIGVIRDAVNDGLCSVTTIFIMFVASVFVISAILHPQVFFYCLVLVRVATFYIGIDLT